MRNGAGNCCEFVDLASELLPLLQARLSRPLDEQIREWQAFYGVHAPELPGRLYRDYEGVEGGWGKIATERIFPQLPALLDRMHAALSNIRAVYREIGELAAERLQLRSKVVIVAYVGLGNGAGWATRWEGNPAVLLGLENIAELNWHDKESLRGLLAHEIGHLLMMEVRGDIEGMTEDPLLSLYEEGFAQHCEHVILRERTWHCASQEGWADWCRTHERDLAREYLRSMDDRERWRRFFGSWFDVDGWRQTGYYLGCLFIEELSATHELRELAGWPEAQIREHALGFLTSVAHRSGQMGP